MSETQYIGGTPSRMPDGDDGCLRYKMTRDDGTFFYAKTYGRDAITSKFKNDAGWTHTHNHGDVKCYQWGHPLGEEEPKTDKTALDLTDEPKVVEAPKTDTLTTVEAIALAGAALNLKAHSATTTSLDECTQAILGLSIKLMKT